MAIRRDQVKPQAERRPSFCDTLTDRHDELARAVLSRTADKWPLWIMQVLSVRGPALRFSRLHEEVEGVSQKMLAQTLKHLERDGLVSRRQFAEVPPRVEYSLTPLGHELLSELLPLWRWVASRADAFDAARERFDAAGR